MTGFFTREIDPDPDNLASLRVVIPRPGSAQFQIQPQKHVLEVDHEAPQGSLSLFGAKPFLAGCAPQSVESIGS